MWSHLKQKKTATCRATGRGVRVQALRGFDTQEPNKGSHLARQDAKGYSQRYQKSCTWSRFRTETYKNLAPYAQSWAKFRDEVTRILQGMADKNPFDKNPSFTFYVEFIH